MTQMKSIRLDSPVYPKPRAKHVGDMKFFVTMSPYFSPERIKFFLGKDKQITIEFVYLDQEDESQLQEEFVDFDLWLGKRTSKLQRVSITFDDNNQADFEDQIVRAINHATDLASNSLPSMSDNYKLVCDIVGRHVKEIVKSVCSSISVNDQGLLKT